MGWFISTGRFLIKFSGGPAEQFSVILEMSLYGLDVSCQSFSGRGRVGPISIDLSHVITLGSPVSIAPRPKGTNIQQNSARHTPSTTSRSMVEISNPGTAEGIYP